MTTPETVADEQGQLEEEQQPPGETCDLESVRAYMLRLLEEGRGQQAIELLLDLLGRLREAHSSTAVRLQHALRQLYGRRSEKGQPGQLQMLLELLTQPAPAAETGLAQRPKARPRRGPGPRRRPTYRGSRPGARLCAAPRRCPSTWSGARWS